MEKIIKHKNPLILNSLILIIFAPYFKKTLWQICRILIPTQ